MAFASMPPILTAAEIRAAEAASGMAGLELMERAGSLAAAAILGFGCPRAVTVLCGPGGNGGDGYVVARRLAGAEIEVVVAADGAPTHADAARMAERWAGAVVALADAPARRGVIDALFGVGLTRPLDAAARSALDRQRGAGMTVALDLPSGVASDTGALLGRPLAADLTVAFGALKPAHRLFPAAGLCGRIVTADLGLETGGATLRDNVRPARLELPAETHKFARGAVLVIGGSAGQGGAARLAARAALHAGAGLVTVAAGAGASAENAARLDAVMVRDGAGPAEIAALLADPRWTAVVVGPGLGTDRVARERLGAVLASRVPAVLDGDIFTLFAGDSEGLRAALHGPAVLTPHAGEFARLFGERPGSKVERARAAAERTGAVVVLKGEGTVVAAPDGRAAINGHASPHLATAGSGDVLAGVIAARLAGGDDVFAAACAGVWLHGDAGRRGGPGLTADDLPGLLHA